MFEAFQIVAKGFYGIYRHTKKIRDCRKNRVGWGSTVFSPLGFGVKGRLVTTGSFIIFVMLLINPGSRKWDK
jgi:hypothetical protein